MNFLLKILTFAFVLIFVTVADEKAEEKLTCRKTDPDYQSCLLTNLIRFIPRTLMGIPEYNITKADPLDIPYLVFNRTVTEDTTIIATVKNIRIMGFSKPNVHSIKITNLEDLTGEFSQSFSHANLTFEHLSEGKLLSLPLGIEGKSSANFTDIFVHGKVRFKSMKRGQQRYFAVDRLSLKDHIADGHVKITAKNPQDQPASDFIANFVNSNTRPVFDRFSILYKKTCEDVTRFLVDRALAKVPAEQLFLE